MYSEQQMQIYKSAKGRAKREQRKSDEIVIAVQSGDALTDEVMAQFVNAGESYNSGRPLAFGKNFKGTEIRTKTGDSIAQTGKERKEQRQTYMYKQSAFL